MIKAGSYSFGENNFKIFDNLLEGVSVYEPVYDNGKVHDFIIKYVNPATIAGSGNSYKHYIGKYIGNLYGIEHLELYFKIFEEIIATGKSKTFKAYLPPLNRYYQVSGFQNPDGFFVMLRVDITDQEKAERELKNTYDNLEIKVHEKTNELQKANEELKQEIKEKKRVESKLIESENRYRKLLENSFDAVVIHNDGKLISANSAAMDLFGVKNPEEFVDTPLLNFVHPDYRETVIERIGEMLKNKAVPPIEEKFLSVDGKVIDVEVLATGFHYKGENAVQVVFRDITERKMAEKALKESEEKFRLIFNKANDMLTLSELQENGMPGKYIEVNEVGYKRLGYTREEFLDMSPADIVAPNKRDEMPGNAELIAKNGCSNFEIVHVAKDGRKIPVEINGHMIDYKGRKVYLTVSRDITKRKQMSKALNESEEKFRKIFNNASDMITLHEMNENGMPGKFIEVNEVGCNRLGYTNEEFQKMAPVDIVAPDKRVEMASQAIEVWTNGYAKFEIVHIAKDGRRVPVEVNTHIFKFRGKTVALGVSRDITERKGDEEKLKKLLDQLSHSNEEFEQCIYITVNYLQEHLGIITDLTKQLKNEYTDKLDINIDDFINSIADESVNLKQILFNLLEYESISRAKKSFKLVDIEKFIHNALSDLKINKNNVEISYDQLPKVIADSDQINKVFQNLIINAIDFKKEDRPLKIHISARKDDKKNEYVFSIQDNGIGMDSQCVKHIFTTYYHLYLREQHHITGTCLFLTKKIVERHGGKIWAESEQGVGSTFYFTLPVNQLNSSKTS